MTVVLEMRRLVAWLSYTFSHAVAQQGLGGPMDLFPFDQTHNLVALASYDLGRGWSVGGLVRLTTGIPTTPVIAAVYDADADLYIPIDGPSGSGPRLPTFFSLDLRVDRRFTFDTWMLSLYLDVTNATNYPNVESRIYDYDYTESEALPGLPIFPSIGIKAEM